MKSIEYDRIGSCDEKAFRNSQNTADDAERRERLKCGYKEMSRINLSFAETSVAIDNEALALCEEKLAECE